MNSSYDKNNNDMEFHMGEILFEDLFVFGEIHTIIDGSFVDKNYGNNGKKLLSILKEKATTISENTTCAKNDYNLTYSIHNVYKYNDFVITVTSSMPRSLKHIKYEFECS